MDNTKIKAMNKFNYLNEYGDMGHDYDKKHYRKQANRFERHTNKQLDKLVLKRYNKDIK